ncbi:MAG: FkbM family methyltransferase [Myxococcota bacterium]
MVHTQVQGYFDNHALELGPAPVVLDVGANIGLFALELRRRYPDATIYAFEPIPAIYQALVANAETHGGGRIRPIPEGLSQTVGEARFVFYPRSTVLSTRYPEGLKDNLHVALQDSIASTPQHMRWFQWLPNSIQRFVLRQTVNTLLAPQEVTCTLNTLSNALRTHGVSRVDLLKIDAEQSELEVLQGIDDAHWPGIQQLVIEVHDIDGRLEQITTMLRAQGFTRLRTSKEAKLENLPIFSLHALRPASTAGS